MTTSTLPARYKINGLLDTKDPVFDNIEKICNACGTFMTYDIHEGKWSVIINKAETTIAKAFDDSNIVGAIQVNGTSVLNLYNSVRVEYPLRDTADGTDFVSVEIPAGDRYANEPDNVLQIRLDMCNEPVQAEIIGLIELKQARIDQIITFQSDYSTLNLNAGDLITVTNDIYQFSAKQFRVITLKEIDSDDGSIRIEVTALAYDANVYDTSDLGRYIRSDRNGIKGIGAIGQPDLPVIYEFEVDVRPRITVEAVVPSGIVESMELWYSSDNTNFTLVGTEYPVGGVSFNPGDTVTFDYDKIPSSNIYVKIRGMNSTTTGPWSTTASFLSYVPVQTTDAVTDNTSLIDSGAPLATLLGLPLLLKALDSFLNGNQNMGNVVASSTGAPVIAASYEVNPISNSGNQVPPWAGGSDPYVTTNNLSFTVPTTGNYLINCSADFGASGGATGNSLKRVDVAIVNGSTHGSGSVVNYAGTSATSDIYDDLQVQFVQNLTSGTNYHLEMSYYANAGTYLRMTTTVVPSGSNIWKNY